MNLLARREQSFLELFQKLSEKYPDLDRHEIVLPALERLREESLQSDARFVEAYVRYRRTRGIGPLKISMELRQKGVDDHLAQAELYNEAVDWVEECRQVLFKRFPGGPASALAEKEKQYRFLNQRGFEGEQVRAVLG